MLLYWSFVAEAVLPHALFYALCWRFAARRAGAPWWAHIGAVALLSLQGAVWNYAANLGGPPASGGAAWLLVVFLLPAGTSLAAAWFVREGVRLRTPEEHGQLPRPAHAILAVAILGLGAWGLALCFTALLVAIALADVRGPAAHGVASGGATQGAPGRGVPAPIPPGYTMEGPAAPSVSPEAAQLAAEQEWNREANDWAARNPRFMADPARAAAMQQAIDEAEQSSGVQIGSRDLLARAEAIAFQRTGWGEQLRRREGACGDTFTRKLRALDGMDLGEFAARHETIVAEKDRCYQAAR